MARKKTNRRNEHAIAVLARNIRKYRQEQNITIEQLANTINVEYAHVGRIERQVGNPTVSMIFALAEALHVRPAQLLEE